MSGAERILVFPSSTGAAIDFLRGAATLGSAIVGASSLQIDPNSGLFDHWFRLPMVTEESFETEFLKAIDDHNIRRIFCPVNAAHRRIADILENQGVDVVLLPLPFDLELARYDELAARCRTARGLIDAISANGSRLSPVQVGAILNFTDSIWGQCGEVKLAALMAAMVDAPRGDIVEIGVFLGKSLSALVLLARWLEVGSVLAIDPWTAQDAIQKDAPGFVQDLSLGTYWNPVANQFKLNLAPIAGEMVNYIRDTSAAARSHYDLGAVSSEEFGATRFCGRIALLHVDGNHDYAAVRRDAELWLPLLAPGGWAVFDDYCWPHGDGPRRVADQILREQASAVHTSFACDGAMFIKFASSPSPV